MTNSSSSAVVAWLEHLDPRSLAVVHSLRAVVRRVAPGATEEIKWGQLVFSLDRNFAFVKVTKAHVVFGFFDGAGLDDPEGLLGGNGKLMRSLRIGTDGTVPAAALSALLRQAILHEPPEHSRSRRT